jgi:DNA polymerase-4
MPSTRTIIHCDQNAFFASVEQQANPDLQGKPIAVVGGGHRTVITTSSYEARARGVKTGMSIYEGRRNCPELIIVVGDKKYMDTSRKIGAIFKDYTPQVETFSIDEAFLDVTGSLAMFGSAENIAYQIKSRIRHQFGLTCSIGIAPNKLLAKLASEMHKPDGLTILRPEEVASVLERVPIGELCGIGKKMEQHLHLLGIQTCGQLGRYPVAILKNKFGKVRESLHFMGLGVDTSPVVPDEEAEAVKSVGHSMTLPRDIDSREEILRYLLQLSEMVGRRARRYGVSGKTVSFNLRYTDFDSSFNKQQTLRDHINLTDDIYQAAVAILDTVQLAQPVRLLGITLTNLRHQGDQALQMALFPEDRRKAQLTAAMDEVNSRFGDFKVMQGSLLVAGRNEEHGSHVISPVWRPDGIRSVKVK